MKKLFSFLFIFMMISVFCVASAENSMQKISDLLGRFGKMSDGLDRLKCRPDNGRSIYGFYLGRQPRKIPYSFELDEEYIIIISSENSVDCQITDSHDGRMLAEQKGSRVYLKYSPKNVLKTELSITGSSDEAATILLIMRRDRYSLPLPFEDTVSLVREMADSSICRSRNLTDKTDYFLVGGTFTAYESDEYSIAEGLVSGLRFVVGHSKTVGEVALELRRGSGVSNRVEGHGLQSIDAKTTRQSRYSVLYQNDSPLVFEHGILLLGILER